MRILRFLETRNCRPYIVFFSVGPGLDDSGFLHAGSLILAVVGSKNAENKSER